jgi:type I restriction enzyme S subunit
MSSNQEITELKELLNKALERLYKNDKSLIKRGANERAITSRFARYVEDLVKISSFKSLDVDVEYNRNGNEPKRTNSSPQGTYPDVLLHKREFNDNNKLVVEFKCYWSQVDDVADRKKLIDFTSSSDRYQYRLGAFVYLQLKDFKVTYFVNGRPESIVQKRAGVMSSEWQTFKLDDVGKIVTGKTPKTSNLDNFGGAVPFVTPTDMDGRKKISSTARCLTEAGVLSVKNSFIPAGSIMVSCIGSDMGKSVIAGKDCVTNQQINSIVVKQEFKNEFVYYNLSMRKNELRNLASSGSTMPILNKSGFSEIEIKIPPLSTQCEISSILGALDDRITLLRETNATLEAIAQALFKSWFVDFDPVHAKQQGRLPEGMDEQTAALFSDSFEESELGLVPLDWEISALYDLAEYINGAAYKAFEPNLERQGLPIIKIAELKAGVTNQTAFSNVKMAEKFRINMRDILFSWSGNPDTSIDTFVWSHETAWLNQHIFRVVPNSDNERSFVLLTLKYMKPIFAEIARNKQTTGLGHVTVADLKRLQIIKPSLSVLQKWSEIVDPIVEQMFMTKQQAQTLADLRDTLLPRLISGQLRVGDLEELTT